MKKCVVAKIDGGHAGPFACAVANIVELREKITEFDDPEHEEDQQRHEDGELHQGRSLFLLPFDATP